MVITILIFIIILGVLVFVHEFGHFIVAKKSGMQVDEFGFGFPPRLVGIQRVNGKWKWVLGRKAKNEVGNLNEATIYSINTIPLGGFVKIRGENNENQDDPRSFINKGFWPRFFTLVAGVAMNWLLAAFIFSSILMLGTLSEIGPDMPAGAKITNRQVAVSEVLEKSPAQTAGLLSGDFIVSVDGNSYERYEDLKNYIYANKGKAFEFKIQRIDEIKTFKVQSLSNPTQDQGPTGISLTDIAKVSLPPVTAVRAGFNQAYTVTGMIFDQLGSLFTGRQGFKQVGGPVKIAKIVGQVRHLGIVPLLNLTALLSLSLAVLNIMPFPALDGGRVLFLFIEKLRRKRNNQKVEQAFNALGFIFLLLLMLVVTANDIFGK